MVAADDDGDDYSDVMMAAHSVHNHNNDDRVRRTNTCSTLDQRRKIKSEFNSTVFCPYCAWPNLLKYMSWTP